MKVLAVDPGYDRLGIAVLDDAGGEARLCHSSCVTTDKTAPLNTRLTTIGTAFEELLATHKPDVVGIETLFFNKNTKTAMGVAQVRGILIYLASSCGCSVMEFGPQQIKVAVTGYGKSDKRGVFDMIKRLVANVPEGALDDEYDAIAVGITCLAHKQVGR